MGGSVGLAVTVRYWGGPLDGLEFAVDGGDGVPVLSAVVDYDAEYELMGRTFEGVRLVAVDYRLVRR